MSHSPAPGSLGDEPPTRHLTHESLPRHLTHLYVVVSLEIASTGIAQVATSEGFVPPPEEKRRPWRLDSEKIATGGAFAPRIATPPDRVPNVGVTSRFENEAAIA